MMEEYMIRPADGGDEAALFDICVRTSDRGGDGRHCYSDPRYPGFIWAIPYLKFSQDHTFVLCRNGRVVGYAAGTPDTQDFERKLETLWWPGLLGTFCNRGAIETGDAYILDYIRHPEKAPEDIARRFPAHLHINLLPEAQGQGRGSRLLSKLLTSLSGAGAKGVHLGVNASNEAVTAFYRKSGFVEIARLPSIIMAKMF